jgi:hypothetical protein
MVKRLASSVLLAGGIVFVFAGLSAALGSTAAGMMASIAAIAALLYAGATWFGSAPQSLASAGGLETVLVFDRSLRIAAGGTPGTPLLSHFPEPLRPDLETACRLALRGEHTHFDCDHRGARIFFDISPVQSISGMVLYGVLITGSGVRVPAAAAAPIATVA